jgi:DNA repair photolyase
MLYRTKVEYGDWAMNHVQGCSHGCRYPCYAFLMARRFGRVKTYEDWLHPFIVDNTLDLLHKELPKHKDEIKRVQLCFTTDPFMTGYPEVAAMSIEAIKLINSYDIPCVVLTKGVLPMGLTQLSDINMYGVTLVSLDERFRAEMEPGSAPIGDRIRSLRSMHDAGFKTWVSMEPYPTPNVWDQELLPILNAIGFTDRIVFGRTHYDSRTSSYSKHDTFYCDSANQVKEFCECRQIACHIKKGTCANAR